MAYYHVFYIDHPNVQKSLLEASATKFFQWLKTDFWDSIFNEIYILRKHPWDREYMLASLHTTQEYLSHHDTKGLSKEISFFAEKVLRRWILANHEGVFDLKQNGGRFDAMVRVGDWYICFNNTVLCIDIIESQYGISREKLVNHIRDFVSIFK